jgi:hypothetical protein
MDHTKTHTTGANHTSERGASTLRAMPKGQMDAHARIAELETENSRLQQLVAELLIKNHQLRKPIFPE